MDAVTQFTAGEINGVVLRPPPGILVNNHDEAVAVLLFALEAVARFHRDGLEDARQARETFAPITTPENAERADQLLAYFEVLAERAERIAVLARLAATGPAFIG